MHCGGYLDNTVQSKCIIHRVQLTKKTENRPDVKHVVKVILASHCFMQVPWHIPVNRCQSMSAQFQRNALSDVTPSFVFLSSFNPSTVCDKSYTQQPSCEKLLANHRALFNGFGVVTIG